MRVPSDGFSLRVEDSNGSGLHLHLSGRFDALALPALADAIGTARGRDVVLDLQELTFMDWPAWLAVMHCEHLVQDWGRNLRLVNVDGRIRKVFERTETEYLLAQAAGG